MIFITAFNGLIKQISFDEIEGPLVIAPWPIPSVHSVRNPRAESVSNSDFVGGISITGGPGEEWRNALVVIAIHIRTCKDNMRNYCGVVLERLRSYNASNLTTDLRRPHIITDY